MIELNYSSALLLYFFIWFGVILFLWVRASIRVNRHQWYLSNSKLFHCDSCHHTFLTKDGANLTRCPKCNAICIAKKRYRL